MNDFQSTETTKVKVFTEEYDNEEVFEQELEEEEDGVDEVSKKKKKKKVRFLCFFLKIVLTLVLPNDRTMNHSCEVLSPVLLMVEEEEEKGSCN